MNSSIFFHPMYTAGVAIQLLVGLIQHYAIANYVYCSCLRIRCSFFISLLHPSILLISTWCMNRIPITTMAVNDADVSSGETSESRIASSQSASSSSSSSYRVLIPGIMGGVITTSNSTSNMTTAASSPKRSRYESDELMNSSVYSPYQVCTKSNA
jgi:hypothetical protein